MEKTQSNHKRHATRKRLGKIFRDEDRLLFASFVVVMTALVVLAAVYTANKNAHIVYRSVESAPAAPTKVLTSQQLAESAVYKIAVSAVGETDKHDPAFTISDDETMLIATLTITNTSDHVQELIPATQLFVRNNQGNTYNMHPSVHVTDPMQSVKVAPGQTVKGQVSFAVPKSLERPLLYVDLGWGDFIPVVYDVLH